MVKLTFRKVVKGGKLLLLADVRAEDPELLEYLKRKLEDEYEIVGRHVHHGDEWIELEIMKYTEPHLLFIEYDCERLIRKVQDIMRDWRALKKLEGTNTIDVRLNEKEE
ncbi:MAG: hypothetical protein ACXQTR_03440 [Candidatus Methanospirareceae archaeon]